MRASAARYKPRLHLLIEGTDAGAMMNLLAWFVHQPHPMSPSHLAPSRATALPVADCSDAQARGFRWPQPTHGSRKRRQLRSSVAQDSANGGTDRPATSAVAWWKRPCPVRWPHRASTLPTRAAQQRFCTQGAARSMLTAVRASRGGGLLLLLLPLLRLAHVRSDFDAAGRFSGCSSSDRQW